MINYKRAKDLYRILTGQAPAAQKKPQAAAKLRQAQIGIIIDQLRQDVLKLAEGVTPDPGLEDPAGWLFYFNGRYYHVTAGKGETITAVEAVTLLAQSADLTIILLCASDCSLTPELKGRQVKTVKVKDAAEAAEYIEDLTGIKISL